MGKARGILSQLQVTPGKSPQGASQSWRSGGNYCTCSRRLGNGSCVPFHLRPALAQDSRRECCSRKSIAAPGCGWQDLVPRSGHGEKHLGGDRLQCKSRVWRRSFETCLLGCQAAPGRQRPVTALADTRELRQTDPSPQKPSGGFQSLELLNPCRALLERRESVSPTVPPASQTTAGCSPPDQRVSSRET